MTFARAASLVVVTAFLVCARASSMVAPAHIGVDVRLMPDATTFEAVVPRDATLENLLREQLPADLSRSIVSAVAGVFNPRELRADRVYQITRGLDGLFREFRYHIDADRLLRVVPVFGGDAEEPAGTFDVSVVPVLKDYAPAAIEATISREHDSLIGAFNAAGENIQLPLRVAEIFAGEVDFNSELRRGDGVSVLFDRALREGEFAGYGDVKAAILSVRGRRLTAIRFTGADGLVRFYDEQGRSLRRQFLKSPLPFNPRVTSGFSRNRFHPVLRTSRPHLGVDYGAPAGTPVNAVASGTVVSAEWAGEAGRMVRIRHAGGLETAYLHLSAFGPGIRRGSRVEQGDMIGRVGQSGTATGPHLDFRVIKNGVYLNPVTAFSKMPPGEPIPADQLPQFRLLRDEIMQELQRRLAATSNAPATPATIG
jgi:murein DD-endopeptidase MepM/ murein hydrolase activator NlpD